MRLVVVVVSVPTPAACCACPEEIGRGKERKQKKEKSEIRTKGIRALSLFLRTYPSNTIENHANLFSFFLLLLSKPLAACMQEGVHLHQRRQKEKEERQGHSIFRMAFGIGCHVVCYSLCYALHCLCLCFSTRFLLYSFIRLLCVVEDTVLPRPYKGTRLMQNNNSLQSQSKKKTSVPVLLNRLVRMTKQEGQRRYVPTRIKMMVARLEK